jgi:hypothetical protein
LLSAKDHEGYCSNSSGSTVINRSLHLSGQTPHPTEFYFVGLGLAPRACPG